MSALAPPPDAVGSRVDAASDPYKFLDFFEERDSLSFAGRDRDIQECLERISTQRLFVLYARSGFGKTSLLKAGLFPRLRERGLRPVYVRTLQDPLRDLRAAIAAEAGPSPKAEATAEEPLAAMIRRLPSAGRVVLVLDQFEEFFIRFRDRRELRKAFLEAVQSLVNDPDLDVHLVFSLREDYLAELDDVQVMLPRLFERSYRLPPLTAFGAREAITRPLDRHGIAYSPTLVTRMVDQLDEVDLDPPLLQIFCTEVFRQAAGRHDGKRILTDDDVKAVGGLDGIFRRYLDAVTDDPILKNNPLLARNILDALLTQEDTKRAVTLAELTTGRFRATGEEIAPILSILVDRYLVRRSLREDAEWYELIHERLVPFVKEWLDRDAGFLNFRLARDLITYTNRGQHWRNRSYLLLNAGQVGGVIKPFRSLLSLDQSEAEFVFTSALLSRSEEAAFWAEQVGLERSTALFLTALHGEDRDFRMGAATVAGAMPDPTGRIAQACLSFSSEPDQEIRRAAARSYTRLQTRYGKREERSAAVAIPIALTHPVTLALQGLKTRLDRAMPVLNPFFRRIIRLTAPVLNPVVRQVMVSSSWSSYTAQALTNSLRTRGVIGTGRHIAQTFSGTRPDIDFLAERAEAGDTLPDVPLWLRFYARSIASGRLQAAQALMIRNHSNHGAIAGLVAGLFWSVLILPSVFQFQGWLTTDEPGWSFVPRDSTSWITMVAGIVSAGIVGFLATEAEARGALIRGKGFHPFGLARSRVLLAPLGYFVLTATNSWIEAVEGSNPKWPFHLHLSNEGFYATLLFFLVGLVISSPLWNRFFRMLLGTALIIQVGTYIVGGHELVGMGLDQALNNPLTYLFFLLIFLLALASCLLLLSVMLFLTRRCLDEGSTFPRDAFLKSCLTWVIPSCVGLPLVFLAAVNLPVVYLAGRWPQETGRLALVLCYLVAVCVPARLQAWKASPLILSRPEPSPPASTLARRVVIAAMIFLPIGFSLIWGFDSFPWGGRTFDLTDPGLHVVSLSAGPASPDVGYAAIRTRAPSVLYLKKVEGPLERLWTRQAEPDNKSLGGFEASNTLNAFKADRWYWLPQGQVQLKLKRDAAADATQPANEALELGFERRELPSSADDVVISERGSAPYALRFERGDHDVWVGRISGAWPEANPKFRPAIRLTRLASTPVATRDLKVDGAEAIGWPTVGFSTKDREILEQSLQAQPPIVTTRLDDPSGNFGSTSPQDVTIYPEERDGRWTVSISGKFDLIPSAAKLLEFTLVVNVGGTSFRPWEVPVSSVQEPPKVGEHPPASSIPPPRVDAIRTSNLAKASALALEKQTTSLLKNWGAVASLYEKARRAGADGADVHFQLSWALANRGDLGQAIEEGRIAVGLDPTNKIMANTLAWRLCMAGRYAEALPFAKRATRGAGASADWWDTLAHAAYGSGNWSAAVDAWERTLKLSPGFLEDESHLNCVDDLARFKVARRKMMEAMDEAFPREPFAPSS